MQYKSIENAYKILQVYGALCKPLCQEIKMPQTAFDILMFLANNPEYVYQVLRERTKKARAKARETLKNVKKAMMLDYFED